MKDLEQFVADDLIKIQIERLIKKEDIKKVFTTIIEDFILNDWRKISVPINFIIKLLNIPYNKKLEDDIIALFTLKGFEVNNNKQVIYKKVNVENNYYNLIRSNINEANNKI